MDRLWCILKLNLAFHFSKKSSVIVNMPSIQNRLWKSNFKFVQMFISEFAFLKNKGSLISSLVNHTLKKIMGSVLSASSHGLYKNAFTAANSYSLIINGFIAIVIFRIFWLGFSKAVKVISYNFPSDISRYFKNVTVYSLGCIQGWFCFFTSSTYLWACLRSFL